MSRFRVPLMWTTVGLMLGNAVFTAIAGITWENHFPGWAERVSSGVFLLAVITIALTGLGFWQEWRKRLSCPELSCPCERVTGRR